MNREAIFSAIFDRARQIEGIETLTRKFIDPQRVDDVAMPALCQRQITETHVRKAGLPDKPTLAVEWWIYVAADPDDDETPPSAMLNPIVDALEAAMEPQGADLMQGKNTLGGLVQHAWIEGSVEIYEGALTACTVAIVTIHVLV